MEEIDQNPSQIHRFIVSKILHANVVDMSKKRKLLDMPLSSPIRKKKFWDKSRDSEFQTPFEEDPEAEEVSTTKKMEVNNEEVHHGAESVQMVSAGDSNSFVEESDCAMSQYTKSKFETQSLSMCPDDQPVNSEPEFPKVSDCDKPSTSSGICDNNSKDRLYSLDNRSIKKLCVEEEKLPFIEDEHLEFGYHADYIYSDHGTGQMEECLDTESKDALLYSNGASSDLFILSSGRWKINQDAQAGMRKPTIDQEFEQYFSMLML
ncbi:hypothetical protein IFM89_000580 [Coptis chinensis]|uniref:Uncharacterized protein n=1 Tax=Coptis chinensis TaxID=261450 RepID=A0A835LK65_9MAGN|nr:hypothetical protein IFM89_000580 [Coptis chinensis]